MEPNMENDPNAIALLWKRSNRIGNLHYCSVVRAKNLSPLHRYTTRKSAFEIRIDAGMTTKKTKVLETAIGSGMQPEPIDCWLVPLKA